MAMEFVDLTFSKLQYCIPKLPFTHQDCFY